MGVPNNDTFNLQDVCDEIYGNHVAGRNLSDCFTSAIAARFDPAYSGSKNSLLNFRNYHLPVIQATVNLVHINATTTKLDVSVTYVNTSFASITFKIRIQNITKASGWKVGVAHVVPAGTASVTYNETITFTASNVTGNSVSLALSSDNGTTWTATLINPGPYNLPFN